MGADTGIVIHRIPVQLVQQDAQQACYPCSTQTASRASGQSPAGEEKVNAKESAVSHCVAQRAEIPRAMACPYKLNLTPFSSGSLHCPISRLHVMFTWAHQR